MKHISEALAEALDLPQFHKPAEKPVDQEQAPPQDEPKGLDDEKA